MLYLEDYIELIEQLPQDLRDRFTDMRELDLKVQNTIDTLDTRVRKFFSEARKSKSSIDVEKEYANIHSCYKLALDDADEKVSMASQVYDLVDRHLRKLDQELSRFKIELEADCSGITEILERRSMTNDSSLDLLYNNDATNNHKRKFGDIERLSTAGMINGFASDLPSSSEKSFSSMLNVVSSNSSSSIPLKNNGLTSSLLRTNKPIFSDNLKEQGRGVQASLKAMTAAKKKAEQLGNSLSMSGLLGRSSSHKSTISSSSYVDVIGGYHPTHGQSTSTTTTTSASNTSIHSHRMHKGGRRGQKTITNALATSSQSDSKYPGPTLDWVPDPNEPTYCLCNQVSYGEMVGCDNSSCSIEWFHYGCVGLTDAPKGKWYCPDCAAHMKKRRIR